MKWFSFLQAASGELPVFRQKSRAVFQHHLHILAKAYSMISHAVGSSCAFVNRTLGA